MILARMRLWWRNGWAKRLGWSADPFPTVLADLQDRLLVIEKHRDALSPTERPKSGKPQAGSAYKADKGGRV